MQGERKLLSGVATIDVGDLFIEDLLMEILSRLPVRTLLQFQVVCKSWYGIIKNPYFISKHLKNYCSNNDDRGGCLITQYAMPQVGELQVHELLVDDKTYKVLAYETIRTPKYNTYLCGPCDGIYYQWCKGEDERFLWNPALNEFKVLPRISMNPTNSLSHMNFDGVTEFYGFGYDSVTKDYKVIVIKGYKDTTKYSSHDKYTDYPLSIFIYSLRNDSWRYWGDLPKYYYLSHNTCYVFVNDNVYWLGSTKSYSIFDFDVIISFNLASENFQELHLPSYDKAVEERPTLAVCDDSIALLFGYNEKKCFVMWSFNEGFWIKKCTINIDFNVYCRPLGHWKKNTLLFQGDYTLILYDLETNEICYLEYPMDVYGKCVNISAYKEGLVSIID